MITRIYWYLNAESYLGSICGLLTFLNIKSLAVRNRLLHAVPTAIEAIEVTKICKGNKIGDNCGFLFTTYLLMTSLLLLALMLCLYPLCTCFRFAFCRPPIAVAGVPTIAWIPVFTDFPCCWSICYCWRPNCWGGPFCSRCPYGCWRPCCYWVSPKLLVIMLCCRSCFCWLPYTATGVKKK